MDIWTYDTRSHAWDRITPHPGDDIFPLWSRDGASIVYGSVRQNNTVDLYRTLVNGPPGSEELLLSTSREKFPIDLSADGRFLLYDGLDPKQGFDIWALPLEGDALAGVKFPAGVRELRRVATRLEPLSQRRCIPFLPPHPFRVVQSAARTAS